MLSFFTLDVLDEIWDLTESVSEEFLTFSFLFTDLFQGYIDMAGVVMLTTRESILGSMSVYQMY